MRRVKSFTTDNHCSFTFWKRVGHPWILINQHGQQIDFKYSLVRQIASNVPNHDIETIPEFTVSTLRVKSNTILILIIAKISKLNYLEFYWKKLLVTAYYHVFRIEKFFRISYKRQTTLKRTNMYFGTYFYLIKKNLARLLKLTK